MYLQLDINNLAEDLRGQIVDWHIHTTILVSISLNLYQIPFIKIQTHMRKQGCSNHQNGYFWRSHEVIFELLIFLTNFIIYNQIVLPNSTSETHPPNNINLITLDIRSLVILVCPDVRLHPKNKITTF